MLIVKNKKNKLKKIEERKKKKIKTYDDYSSAVVLVQCGTSTSAGATATAAQQLLNVALINGYDLLLNRHNNNNNNINDKKIQNGHTGQRYRQNNFLNEKHAINDDRRNHVDELQTYYCYDESDEQTSSSIVNNKNAITTSLSDKRRLDKFSEKVDFVKFKDTAGDVKRIMRDGVFDVNVSLVNKIFCSNFFLGSSIFLVAKLFIVVTTREIIIWSCWFFFFFISILAQLSLLMFYFTFKENDDLYTETIVLFVAKFLFCTRLIILYYFFLSSNHSMNL